MSKILTGWAAIICRHATIIIAMSFLIFLASLGLMRNLVLSTDINALMPEGAQSVQTLENALEKIGNYSSVQVVIEGETPEAVIAASKKLQAEFETKEWVQSAKYYEDVEVLIRHELLFLSEKELQELEAEVYKSISIFFARELSEAFNTEVTFTLGGFSGSSNDEFDEDRVKEVEELMSKPPSERRYFISEDETTMILVVAPKPGNESLGDAKIMIDDSHAIAENFEATSENIEVGITGRIAGQVGQFDALIRDLKIGLGSAFLLISLVLLLAYRSFMSIPIIIIPLITGILSTLGLTAITIGQLNLITAFLTLILFGLGIDFGVHNFSRYIEERRAGTDRNTAIQIVINRTGRASFMAAITTAASFFALTQTQFRAFSEFGFIAGSGILFAFLAMYTFFPALLVTFEKLGWDPNDVMIGEEPKERGKSILAMRYPRAVILIAILGLGFAAYSAPKIKFESNTKNLEASMSSKYEKARTAAKTVLGQSSWAVMVADSYDELIAIDAYFTEKRETDTETPTIRQHRSLLSFVPPPDVQERRLAVIRRLKDTADRFSGLAPDKYETGKEYLSIESMSVAALPPLLRQTYLGNSNSPGYLFYIYPDIDMADSSNTEQFYADAAHINLGGKDFYSASESFVLVEMLDLMRSDAMRAVLLVTLTTAFVVWMFFRNLPASLVVLVPPLCGVLLTLGVMGYFGPSLSIMNMVILPSLVGISVDNGIHIVHRVVDHSPNADLNHIMQTTGRAALLTTVTTLIGFGGMITASVGGLRSLAILAIIGFTLCLLMTWFLLPAILNFMSIGKRAPAH
ncbi:MAG: MMPL family transporter [Hellea sp.]|nr:MMPL family transporter [Hellea sp.]